MIDRAEVLRYLGTPTDEGIAPLIDKAVEASQKLSPKHIVSEYAIEGFSDDGVRLDGGIRLFGELAKNSLANCNKVLILIATLTLEADKLIATAGSTISKAVYNATLSAAIEDYVDKVNDDLSNTYQKNGEYLTKRFSPGYGDLPLQLQKELISVTCAEKLLGITVSENMLLTPIKTVTAIIGVSDTPRDDSAHKCEACTKNCIYRR